MRYTEAIQSIAQVTLMTLKETLLQELETADDELITATIDWVRSRKHDHSIPASSGAPIRRGAKLGDLIEFAGT